MSALSDFLLLKIFNMHSLQQMEHSLSFRPLDLTLISSSSPKKKLWMICNNFTLNSRFGQEENSGYISSRVALCRVITLSTEHNQEIKPGHTIERPYPTFWLLLSPNFTHLSSSSAPLGYQGSIIVYTIRQFISYFCLLNII